MTSDIAAVVARVREETKRAVWNDHLDAYIMAIRQKDAIALCDFVETRLAEPSADAIERFPHSPMAHAASSVAEPPADLSNPPPVSFQPAEKVESEVPADLVVQLVDIALSVCEPENADEVASAHTRRVLTKYFVAALAGRIVEPGMVVVPIADLRAALHRAGTIDGLNALGRLRSIAEPDYA